MPRFVVLEAVDEATAAQVAARLGIAPRTVRDPAGAAQAVLAAVAGRDLVVHATAPRDVIDQLCDDLGHLGELDHRVGATGAEPDLPTEQRELLAQLLAGKTLGEAARALHVSRRTADRRLAAARRCLGAANTSEALVLARRAGIAPSR